MPLQTVDRAADGREIVKFTSAPSWPRRYQRPTAYFVMKDGVKLSEHAALVVARDEIGKVRVTKQARK